MITGFIFPNTVYEAGKKAKKTFENERRNDVVAEMTKYKRRARRLKYIVNSIVMKA